jgi:hypothetical protein
VATNLSESIGCFDRSSAECRQAKKFNTASRIVDAVGGGSPIDAVRGLFLDICAVSPTIHRQHSSKPWRRSRQSGDLVKFRPQVEGAHSFVIRFPTMSPSTSPANREVNHRNDSLRGWAGTAAMSSLVGLTRGRCSSALGVEPRLDGVVEPYDEPCHRVDRRFELAVIHMNRRRS